MSIGNFLGGYNIPGITGPAVVNPYASGQAYAQEIAGGLPMEQVIAPGVSYSPDMPGGYTQADLTGPVEPVPTTPVPVPPPTPPVVPPTPPTIPPPIPPIMPPGLGVPIMPPGFLPYQGPEIDFDYLKGLQDYYPGVDPFVGQPTVDLEALRDRDLKELMESMIDMEVQTDLLPKGPRMPDIAGLEERIGALESLQVPTVDLSGIEERLTGLETMPQPEGLNIEQIRQGLLADIPTFTPRTDEEILGLMSQVPQAQMPDISQFVTQADIQQAIAGIPAAPVFDPTGLQQQIAELQRREIPMFDPSGLQGQIAGLETQLSNIPQFDPSGLQSQISALESREMPMFDPSGLQGQIAGLEAQLGSSPQFDPSGLQSQIAGLQQQLGQVPTFDPTGILSRLSALEARPVYDPFVGQPTTTYENIRDRELAAGRSRLTSNMGLPPGLI